MMQALDPKAIEIINNFSGVPETMLLTGYAKARDNRSRNPILGDILADKVVKQLEQIRPIKTRREDHIGAAARAKYFDRWTTNFLHLNPDAIVLNLACGIDTRIYRVNPPSSVLWFDYDFPQTIELRRLIFPNRESSSYQMIPRSVTAPNWLEPVPVNENRPILLLAEGLFMYLSKSEVETIITQVLDSAPSGQLIFDAVNSVGVRFGHLHPAIRAAGAKFDWGIDHPKSLELFDSRLKFLIQSTLGDIPEIKQRSPAVRIASAMLKQIPRLNNMIRFLRYQF